MQEHTPHVITNLKKHTIGQKPKLPRAAPQPQSQVCIVSKLSPVLQPWIARVNNIKCKFYS